MLNSQLNKYYASSLRSVCDNAERVDAIVRRYCLPFIKVMIHGQQRRGCDADDLRFRGNVLMWRALEHFSKN